MDINAQKADRIKDEIDELASAIAVYWNTLVNDVDPPASMEWDLEDRHRLLFACTKIVRLSELTIACYPLSESAVYFLDENGDWLTS